MAKQLQNMQPWSRRSVADHANDEGMPAAIQLRMAATKRKSKPQVAHRLHFIPEWAEKRNLKQAEIVEETGADKGTVSRWFSGNMPQDKYLDALVSCLAVEDVEALFRHPDDDWIARFLGDRSDEEKERIRAILLAAFPKKVA